MTAVFIQPVHHIMQWHAYWVFGGDLVCETVLKQGLPEPHILEALPGVFCILGE